MPGGGGGGGITLGQPTELTAGDANSAANFGASVALSSDGNTALIAAPTATNVTSFTGGVAYVFIRSGSTWTQQAELAVNVGGGFGSAVALSSDGSTALIGASGANSKTGAAYVFGRSGTTWSQRAVLSAWDAVIGDGFGGAVALSSDGSTALIGAYAKNNSAGAAYVFVGSGSIWIQQPELTATDATHGDKFGASVALSGDGNTALIGAYAKNNNAGAAYLLGRSGATWNQQAELTAADGAPFAYFGSSVALNSNGATALIGAPGGAGPHGSGAAYVFVPFFGWYQAAELVPSDGTNGNSFGGSVALSNDGKTALIGAPHASSGATYATGAAYSFQGSWSSWGQGRKITAADGAHYDGFGSSVALTGDGNTYLSGAPGKNFFAGAAYTF